MKNLKTIIIILFLSILSSGLVLAKGSDNYAIYETNNSGEKKVSFNSGKTWVDVSDKNTMLLKTKQSESIKVSYDNGMMWFNVESTFGLMDDLPMKSIVANAIPNPVKNIFSVDFIIEKNAIYQFMIVDSNGETHYETEKRLLAGEKQFEYDASDLKKGVYLLTISNLN